MKLLFCVVDNKTGELKETVGGKRFFDNKMEAKELRDSFKSDMGNHTCHVSPGPNHHQYVS